MTKGELGRNESYIVKAVNQQTSITSRQGRNEFPIRKQMRTRNSKAINNSKDFSVITQNANAFK